MQCNNTIDNCEMNVQSEMLLVQHEIIDLAQRKFTPPIEEVSYIRRQSLSAIPIIVTFLRWSILGSGYCTTFWTVYTVENRGNEDRNCVPISSVFDHFRIMRTTNIRADLIRKRSLSTTGLPYACVDWRETPNVVIATVDVSKNVRRCLTGASSDVYVNAHSLVRPSDDHLLAPSIIKNHDTLDGTIVPISDVFVALGT
ncbi:hypothetical protein Tco_0578554 [Tanacetum coccineum]